MKKIIPFLLVFIFLGCSSRQYFEPKQSELSHSISISNHIKSPVIYFTKDEATLDNSTTLPINKKLPKGFVGIDKDLSKKGYILRVDGKNIIFNSLVVTAKKRGNFVAVLFGDNHFELYDLKQGKSIATENFGQFLALRKFVVAPYFYKDLLLIPTLNGSVVVYDLKAKKSVRNIVVSQKDYFSNIIYLSVKNDSLIMASRDTIIIVTPGMVFNQKYNIRHILVDNSGIYIFTLAGKVIKLNFELKEVAEHNFKYANIVAPMFYKNKIYFISRGDKTYLISIDKNLKKYTINPLSIFFSDNFIDYNTNIFAKDGIYYIGDYYLKLK